MKIHSITELYDLLPENEKLIVDVLRKFLLDHLPEYCKEKISFNVPYFYGSKGICIIWPATIPRGGINSGVLLGFWYGCKLKDHHAYLTKGTNKQIFYKVIHDISDINFEAIHSLIREAVEFDKTTRNKNTVND